MNGDELAILVQQRHAAVVELVELGRAQLDAVQSGRMNELMQLLSQKQQPLSTLGELSKRLHTAIGDDPETRRWASSEMRGECRVQHEQTETMLLDLMQIESECEQQLTKNRSAIEDQIRRSDGAKQANLSYAKSTQAEATCGGSLDLSSQ
ncbi:hypothetical protein SH528x_006463 [Novipirellula sp. SH528]|uniref:hypothetical protein n=1 Tax=Novipirellula sp. SH528 TaxID=3454466 RepID=UPI003FA16EF1